MPKAFSPNRAVAGLDPAFELLESHIGEQTDQEK